VTRAVITVVDVPVGAGAQAVPFQMSASPGTAFARAIRSGSTRPTATIVVGPSGFVTAIDPSALSIRRIAGAPASVSEEMVIVRPLVVTVVPPRPSIVRSPCALFRLVTAPYAPGVRPPASPARTELNA
jgi:hypothetical protein